VCPCTVPAIAGSEICASAMDRRSRRKEGEAPRIDARSTDRAVGARKSQKKIPPLSPVVSVPDEMRDLGVVFLSRGEGRRLFSCCSCPTTAMLCFASPVITATVHTTTTCTTITAIVRSKLASCDPDLIHGSKQISSPFLFRPRRRRLAGVELAAIFFLKQKTCN